MFKLLFVYTDQLGEGVCCTSQVISFDKKEDADFAFDIIEDALASGGGHLLLRLYA